MNIRTKIMPFIFSLSALIPAQAQKTYKALPQKPLVETVVQDTVKIGNKVSKDVSLRTFQFLNGNNLTGVGAGFGINKGKVSAYATPLAGYDFANKKPWIGGMGFIDRRYTNNNKKVWLSQELYGEILKEKGMFDSKVAYTPLKLNAMLSKKVNLSFDPRLAVHINKDGFTPQVETLTTVSAPITKKLSGYALFQTYDTTHLFEKGSSANIGINGGIVYNF